MLDYLIFDQKKYGDYIVTHKNPHFAKNQLTNLSRINIFIGENNSGKSRFLRKLFIDDNYQIQLKDLDVQGLKQKMRAQLSNVITLLNSYGYQTSKNISDRISRLQDPKSFLSANIVETIESLKLLPSELRDNANITSKVSRAGNIKYADDQIMSYINAILYEMNALINSFIPNSFSWQPSNIYIPMLRGLRPIQAVENVMGTSFDNNFDNYKLRTVDDYFHEQQDNAAITDNIYTGLGLYNDIKFNLLNRRERRGRIKSFEDFLSKTFFAGKPISLFPHVDHDVVNIGIGVEDERGIFDMGDGIQSVITMLYPLFVNQGKDLLVFIEEPELSLHPGMQRIFIEALLKEEFRSFQYFITTHSNHFLDITLDLEKISIYTFQKKNDTNDKPHFEVQNTNNDDLRILDLIGARNSSVFLSNCTIWIEGITDRLYLRKYLEVYQQSLIGDAYKEDIHFSFIEYGGGNIVHFSFSDSETWDKIKASRINGRIFLIADQDNTLKDTGTKKSERIESLKKNLQENFRLIDGREIENTLSPNILIKTIQSIEGKKNTLKFDEKKIKDNNYKSKKLGTFIQNNFSGLSRKYEAKSGTIEYKVDFCQKAINEIKTIDDLSDEGRKLAMDIYEFIKKNNA